jgi:Na+/H+-dicarboxylate symporter
VPTLAWPPLFGLLVWLAALGLRRADLGQEAPLAELVVLVIPLIVALLVTGIARTTEAARGGRIAAASVTFFLITYLCSATLGAFLTPVLTSFFPLPETAAEAMRAGLASVDASAAAAAVPKAQDFVRNLIPSNAISAAAEKCRRDRSAVPRSIRIGRYTDRCCRNTA